MPRLHDRPAAAIAARLAQMRITPDQITLASVLPAVLAGGAAAFGLWAAAAVLFLLAGVMDLLDGALARLTGATTRFGALLDSSLDRVADAAIPIGLVAYFAGNGAGAVLSAVALLASVWVSYIRARAQSLQINLPRLWMRREDRFFLILGALILQALLSPVAAWPLVGAMAAIAGLGMVAGAQALWAARQITRQP